MKRRAIRKRVMLKPESYGTPEDNFPRITIRPEQRHTITSPNQYKKIKNSDVYFKTSEFEKTKNKICFVVGGGPSLNNFNFEELNGYDTIAANKSVEYIPNPTYFITTDYTYFLKASLTIEKIKQKTSQTYFIANMVPDYMQVKNGNVVDVRTNLIYKDLYQYTGVITSNLGKGFGDNISEFSHGSNSGHCGIQLALLLGYEKIYLLGFDLNSTGQSHFHQSYKEHDQTAFKSRANEYSTTLLNSLKNYKGTSEIINLSSSSILATSPHISTKSFSDVLQENNMHYQAPTIPTDNSTLDNLMVVGYYTVNTPYEKEAQNLLGSLNGLSVSHDIIGVETLGNWQANTRFKAGFMLDMLNKHPNHRLLYVDVDAVVHSSPDLFKNYKCDIAVRWQDFRWRKNECLSGTIYMENNERTRRICELWRDINVNEGNHSNRMEQWNLDTVINKMKADPNFTYKNLPPEYTMIFDSMRGMYPNVIPVIEHFQASRRFKKDVNKK